MRPPPFRCCLLVGVILGGGAAAFLVQEASATLQNTNETINARLREGIAQLAKDDAKAAIGSFEEARSLAKQQNPVSPLRVAVATHWLAKAHDSAGDNSKARDFYLEALEICKTASGVPAAQLASLWGDPGMAYLRLGQYTEAERHLAESLKRFAQARAADEKSLTPRLWLDWAHHANDIAYLYALLGRYDEARPHVRRSEQILDHYAALGPTAPEVKDIYTDVQRGRGNLLNTKGLIHVGLGEHSEADAAFRQSLLVRQQHLPDRPTDLAQSHSNLGHMEALQGSQARAIKHYEDALKLWPALSLDRARTLGGLGFVYHKRGQGSFAFAEGSYKEALAIWEKLAPRHVHKATTLSNLGWLRYEQKRYDEAEALLSQALSLREGALPSTHHLIALGHSNLAALHFSAGRVADTLREMDKARQSLRSYVADRLPFQTESEQLSFLLDERDPGSHASTFHVSLSLGLRLADDPRGADLSANWVLNGKAIAQEALAHQALAQRGSSEPGAAAHARALLRLQIQLASITLLSPAPDQVQGHLKSIRELEAREQELKIELTRLNANPPTRSWTDVKRVRDALPAGAVLVEIARFRTWDFAGSGAERWTAPAYAAWVIRKDRAEVRVVPLGEAAAIEAAVAQFRKVMKEAIPDPDKPDDKPGSIQELGRLESERVAKESLHKLSDLLLRPLARAGIMQAKHWIISPDADLWLVPWSALPLEDGSYAVEKHAVSYAITGRDLVQPRPTGETGPALVVARPEYGTYDEKKGTGLMFADLKDTEEEARAILPSLEKFSRRVTAPLLGAAATEQAVLANPRPDVVVLSTHGYFLDDELVQRLNRPGLRNPLRRCGLALANAHSPTESGEGLLDGADVTRVDLRGTRLAVLSACDTGVGKINRGEGVASLRQAFHLAGARTVAATLWQVPSETSKELVTEYFRKLADGGNHAEALQHAQRQLLVERPGAKRTSHPLFWAAYALTGPVD